MTLDRSKYLRADERKAVLDHLDREAIVARAKGHRVPVRDHMVFTVAFASGLRPTELAERTVGDLTLGRSEVLLKVRRLKKRGEPVIEEIHLPKSLRPSLEQYVRWLKDAGLGTDPGSPLFPGRTGEFTTQSGLWRRWKQALTGAGVKDRPLRATRHTCGTALYRATKDLRLVQKQLGHVRVTTTAIYADVLDEDMAAGVEKMWDGCGTG